MMHHHYSTLIIVLLQKEIDLLLRADSIKLYLYNIVLSAAPIYYLFIISRLLSEEEELKPSLNSSSSLPYLSSSLATSEKHSSNTLCFVGLLRILIVKKDYASHNFLFLVAHEPVFMEPRHVFGNIVVGSRGRYCKH